MSVTQSPIQMALALLGCFDRMPRKRLHMGIVCSQVLVLALATMAEGWVFYALQFLFMAAIFGAIPFTDAMIVRF